MLAKIIDSLKLKKLKNKTGEKYSKYLELQFQRSREKYDHNSERENKRKKELMNIVSAYVDLNKIENALVIGCRNPYELDLLELKGVKKTTGVDLFSHDKRIVVMDMHNLKFGDKFFDFIYCSHALEHALDYKKVCEEMVRVLKDGGIISIEVPVNYKVQGSDMHDFESSNNLVGLFSSLGRIETLLKENIKEKDSNSGTDISRVIIKIN